MNLQTRARVTIQAAMTAWTTAGRGQWGDAEQEEVDRTPTETEMDVAMITIMGRVRGRGKRLDRGVRTHTKRCRK